MIHLKLPLNYTVYFLKPSGRINSSRLAVHLYKKGPLWIIQGRILIWTTESFRLCWVYWEKSAHYGLHFKLSTNPRGYIKHIPHNDHMTKSTPHKRIHMYRHHHVCVSVVWSMWVAPIIAYSRYAGKVWWLALPGRGWPWVTHISPSHLSSCLHPAMQH